MTLIICTSFLKKMITKKSIKKKSLINKIVKKNNKILNKELEKESNTGKYNSLWKSSGNIGDMKLHLGVWDFCFLQFFTVTFLISCQPQYRIEESQVISHFVCKYYM